MAGYRLKSENFPSNIKKYAVFIGDGFYDTHPEIIKWAELQFGGDGWCDADNERWSYTFSYIWFTQEIDRDWFILKWS